MRPVRYNVAASLDGFIATTDGGYDWIPPDDTIDFAALFAKVDTVLLGRHTWEMVRQMGGGAWPSHSRVYVFSSTLRRHSNPDVTVVNSGAPEVVAGLRAEQGDGEIWLFGGGQLFSSLLAAGQVDRVEVSIVPVLLGGGIPLSAPGSPLSTLTLVDTKRYPTGIITLNYSVDNAR
jgi:dihydrofolate reductase